MKVISANSLDEAFIKGLFHLIDSGTKENSRNGEVYVSGTPVTTEYFFPKRRILFNKRRDANPFFHFLESLWMLAGRKDAAWVSKFNKRMSEYADNGEIHGAYGYRWRKHFPISGDAVTLADVEFDQISEIVDLLKKNPLDRRIVLNMWDPSVDLGAPYKDVPCNTHVYFRVNSNKLDMTVCNRSNDVIWGAYGANAVHMSILQEYIASKLHIDVGKYYQISNNYHFYTDVFIKIFGVDPRNSYTDTIKALASPKTYRLYEENSECVALKLFSEHFDEELPIFMEESSVNVFDYAYKSTALNQIAVPMVKAYAMFRQKDYNSAKGVVSSMPACDWRKSCREWLERKELNNAI